jgi:hypothetical protein
MCSECIQKKQNSDHYIKLILTVLFRELTEEQKLRAVLLTARSEGHFLKRNC